MENGTVQKGQNLLEDFVWPIDTGRLMGDPSYYNIATGLGPLQIPLNIIP
jgi:hypothetical protein